MSIFSSLNQYTSESDRVTYKSQVEQALSVALVAPGNFVLTRTPLLFKLDS